jgi:hypothetical protein
MMHWQRLLRIHCASDEPTATKRFWPFCDGEAIFAISLFAGGEYLLDSLCIYECRDIEPAG